MDEIEMEEAHGSIIDQAKNDLLERVHRTCHYGHPSGQMLKVEDVRKIIDEVMI